MLTSGDLEYILQHLSEPENGDVDGETIRKKLDILHNQMTLQSEFQERSLELRKQMDELTKSC